MEKNKLIVVVIVITLLLAGGLFYAKNKGMRQEKTPTDTQSDVIPTVDSSVKVTLQGIKNNHEIVLTIKGIPQDTEAIDYELSYETKEQGLQGLIGTIDATGKKEADKTVTLGTCSSGTCVYHAVKGTIRVTLKFTGSYGERLFEKEFSL